LHPLSLAECPNCHEKKLPHRACPKCGYYKGREVIDTAAKTA
jgi:large subunit ribosomal protein L32